MAVESGSSKDINRKPFRAGHEISNNSQLRLRRAFKNAATLFDEQFQWFENYEPQIHSLSNLESTEHLISLNRPPLPEDWSLQIGEILNHLSSAKDNLFNEIVRKFSGYSDTAIQKKLGNTYWPACRSSKEWEKIEEKYSFIPKWLLERIEIFQPFRDLPAHGVSPNADWMSMGASTWARNINNTDKHSQPVQLSLNHFLNEPVRLKGTLRGTVTVEQRFDYTDPLSEDPMIKIMSEPSKDVRLKIASIGILLMIRKTSKSSWVPLNRSIWHVLIENQVIFNTVYYGHEAALQRMIPWAYDDGTHLADAVYSWSRKGKFQLRLRPNMPFDALQKDYV